MQRLGEYRISNELKESHDEWCNYAMEITEGKSILFHGNMSLTIAELLYDEALIATKGINATSSQAIGLIQDKHLKCWEGIYLTALLNNRCLEELIVDIEGMSFLGYRLNKGKITINRNSGDYIGLCAEGRAQMQNNAIIRGSFGMSAKGDAIFVNYGDVFSMGNYASEKSTFINKKTCLHLGSYGNGATYINEGDADTSGDSALDGFYLNWGRVYSFGPRTLGGIYVDEGESKHIGYYAVKGKFMPRKMPVISLMERADKNGTQVVKMPDYMHTPDRKNTLAPNSSYKCLEENIQSANNLKELIRISYPELP